MPLVDRLERKFGWIAVPGIVKIIMGLQALVWLLCSFRGDYALLEKIVLHKESILNGEVWRLFSFVIMPPIEPGSNGIIFMLFAVFFSIFLGSMLESIWGSFRLTLYLIGGAAGMVIADFLFPSVSGSSGFHYTRSFLLIESILFACAVYNPHYTVRLFGIIPVKLFWIALFGGGMLVINAISNLQFGISIAICLGNFFIVFVPGMKRSMQMRAQVAVRRNKFEDAKLSENEPLHLCTSCGKTENDDEDLIFRVADNGEEYCEECRGKNAQPSPSVNEKVPTEDVFLNDRPPKREIPKKRRPGQWKE
ncbi:rhomboid family intramembrane serine protease [Verrucomicrobiales bacterium]|nr:rhomboid family intramembrane serine protease [Verrucomicrobiales bacterium]